LPGFFGNEASRTGATLEGAEGRTQDRKDRKIRAIRILFGGGVME
jgi:hypothetical protein